MADVDLLVEVKTAGVPNALANLDNLRSKGLQTSSAMAEIARSTQRAMTGITTSTQGATGRVTGFRESIKQTQGNAVSLSRSLKELEQGYTKISQLAPSSSAADRLKIFGNGDLETGKQMVAVANQLRNALKPDMNRDRLELEKQELALLQRKQQLVVDINARQNASISLSRAREDLANQRIGLTAVQQATINLSRATQDLSRAEAARKATSSSTGYNRERTAALQAEAEATRRLVAAERELVNARSNRGSNDSMGNAFQSSFSYFIIAGMAQKVSQGIISIGSSAITASSEIERSFADVERTFEGTSGQLVSLQGRLKELATQAPISIIDLAEIATLGNQLGIAADDIQSFTTTIAQYTAVSGQSAEDAATAFGRISNLTGLAASQYSNLASAITYVARTTVATESTIQNTAKEITALASGAGLSAESIVGLAGALSSLAIPPERARGALSLYFGALNGAVAEGGPKLAAFAQLTGKTTDEIGKLVRANKGEEVFTSFIAGLSKLDTVAKTTALDTLGLSTIRVDQTMRALAQNVPLVTQSLAGAKQAFDENTEISNQYAIIQETLASKVIELQNAIQLAAGAMGDALEPALKEVISLITDVIVSFTAFAESPWGMAVLRFAGVLTGLVLVMSTLVGAVALVKAGLVVIPWALSGLSATTASRGIIQFTAGLLGQNIAAASGKVQLSQLSLGYKGVGASSAAAAWGVRGLTLALAATGVGLAITLIGTLVEAFMSANDASRLTADNISGLAEALKADTATYNETGKSIATFSSQTAGTTEEQKRAAIESKNWAIVLGKDLVGGANAASDAISKIAAGDQTVEAIRSALGSDDTVSKILSDSSFTEQWQGLGLDMTKFITEGIKGGDLDAQIETLLKQAGITATAVGSGFGGKIVYRDANGKEVTQFVKDLKTIGNTASGTGEEIQGLINKSQNLGPSTEGVLDPLTDGFVGAKSSLTAFQDALGSGLSKFVSFSDILSTVKDKAKEMADSTKDDSFLTSMVNVGAFQGELDNANSSAVNFFNGIATLARGGKTEFATQLASLGPEAQAILSGALELDGEGQAKLEESARFAAFLASDEFKRAFNQGMTDDNVAYAKIFETTGNLADVQSYIAAQVAGVGAEWEKQWAIQHPTAQLRVQFETDLTTESIDVIKRQMDGRLTITPTITSPKYNGSILEPGTAQNIFTDMISGATITLPAELDGQALTDTLAIWTADQNASPEELAAKLNRDGLSSSLTAWRDSNGPITVYARITPLNQLTPATISGGRGIYAKGGEVTHGLNIPKFARGGGFGQFRGPGSGTSDSLLAAVSANEYISTAASTKFWGVDFFDSLNRKMLPASFLNMLGAAVSGNQGPQNVTNVSIVQQNPVTRDPLKQLREDSEMVAQGLWG